MSVNIGIANRYSMALLEVAKERDNVQELTAEVTAVKDILGQNPEFISFLSSPAVSMKIKKEAVKAAFESADDVVSNLIYVLIDNKRAGLLLTIIDHYISSVNAYLNVGEADVYSVVELSEAEEAKLADAFAKFTNNKQMILRKHIDASLIGGVKVVMGSVVYDGSLRSKLNGLAHQIKMS